MNITPRSAFLLALFGPAEPPIGPLPPPLIVCNRPDLSDIPDTVEGLVPAVRSCYERARLRAPSLSGTLTVRFTIRNETATDIGLSRDDIGDDALSACVLDLFWLLPFTLPAQVSEMEVVVRYPFRLVPAE